jgi:hypothetical protein
MSWRGLDGEQFCSGRSSAEYLRHFRHLRATGPIPQRFAVRCFATVHPGSKSMPGSSGAVEIAFALPTAQAREFEPAAFCSWLVLPLDFLTTDLLR